MKKIIIIVFAAITTFCSCKKEYDKTLDKIYGNYLIKSYTVNGVDSLSQYKDSLPIEHELYYNEWDKIYGWNIEGLNIWNDGVRLNMNWRLQKDNKTLSVYCQGPGFGVGPFGLNKKPTWEIIELNDNNFTLKTIYNNKEYIIVLE